MRTISGVFGGHFGPFGDVFVEPIQKRGVSEKNEKFHFFPVWVWGWLRWVALVKIHIFKSFRAQNIRSFLFKNHFFGKSSVFGRAIFKEPSRCPRLRENAISLFHGRFHIWKLVFKAQMKENILTRLFNHLFHLNQIWEYFFKKLGFKNKSGIWIRL